MTMPVMAEVIDEMIEGRMNRRPEEVELVRRTARKKIGLTESSASIGGIWFRSLQYW